MLFIQDHELPVSNDIVNGNILGDYVQVASKFRAHTGVECFHSKCVNALSILFCYFCCSLIIVLNPTQYILVWFDFTHIVLTFAFSVMNIFFFQEENRQNFGKSRFHGHQFLAGWSLKRDLRF